MPAKKSTTTTTSKTSASKKKTAKVKAVRKQVEPTEEKEVENTSSASETALAPPASTSASPASITEEEPKEPETTSQVTHPPVEKSRPTHPAIPQKSEQFDLNSVVLAGAIHSVWGSRNDVFARLALSTRGELVEDDDKFASYVTLRFANGMVDGSPISIQPGSVLKVEGYLTHREYYETLRKFLDDAHAMSFLDLVEGADLPSWRALSFKRQNGVMNVLSMQLLDRSGKALTQFGEISDEAKVFNRANVEGVIARVWEYKQKDGVDLFVRLAVYDSHTPLDPRREGNFGRARRRAHYINVRFPCGKTSSGSPVHLRQKARVRIVGPLRDKGQIVTLRQELLKTGIPAVAEMMGRVANSERMSEITSQQESLHILAEAVVVYSTAGGSRSR